MALKEEDSSVLTALLFSFPPQATAGETTCTTRARTATTGRRRSTSRTRATRGASTSTVGTCARTTTAASTVYPCGPCARTERASFPNATHYLICCQFLGRIKENVSFCFHKQYWYSFNPKSLKNSK